MHDQKKLAIAMSTVFAMSMLSGCSANSATQASYPYQDTIGEVEFQKAAHLLLASDQKPSKQTKKTTYYQQKTKVSTAKYHKKQSPIKFQKASYHRTRTQQPKRVDLQNDLEKAAELLGVTQKPVLQPERKRIYSSVYTSPLQPTTVQKLVKQQHFTQVKHNATSDYRDMWKRIYRGQKMPNYANHPSVRRFIKVYASDRPRLNRITKRASRYLFMVISELERRHMPTELALLPFVESAYVNTARSHAAAAGMWQFIPSTGRLYGLKQRRGYDGRMDSFEATRAALDYLQKLNRQFKGDWFLSLAAYNAGEGRVERAIKYNRRRGRPTNYWNLRLPRETREYVPRLLAYKEIIRNPKRYGIWLPKAVNRPALVTVWNNKVIDLRTAAKRAGLPANTLTDLNPSYLQGVTTPRLSKRIILPVHLAGRLHNAIKLTPRIKDSNYRYAKHSSKKYSKRYKKRYKNTKKRQKRIITHRVRQGETLYRIALRHGTTVKKIMKMNKLRSSHVKAGKRIKIASRQSRKQYS